MRATVKRKGLLFDQISRQVIIDFQQKSKNKGKFWIWYHQNIIVTNYENAKALRKLDDEFEIFITKTIDAFERSLCWKYIDKIMRAVEKPSKID